MRPERTQRIEQPPIALLSKKVDSLSFDGGKSSLSQKMTRGRFTVTNALAGESELQGGTKVHLVTVTISISPQEGYEYYSLEMSVTGAFTASEKIGKDELERTLLTAGTEELYDFAKDRAAILMQGGAFGEPTFPMLKFRFDSEQ